MTDLEKLMRKNSFSSDVDCRTSEIWKNILKKSKLGTFFPTRHFIWLSHTCQFLAYALPIGIWQVLMDPKYIICHFFQNLHFIWLSPIFQFWSMPSLLEYDKSLYFFWADPVAGVARREHTWSFLKNNSISPIETSFVKVCSRRAAVPYMTGTK